MAPRTRVVLSVIICFTSAMVALDSPMDNNIEDGAGTSRKQRNIMLYQTLFEHNNAPEEIEASARSETPVCATPLGATGICYTESDCEELGGLDMGSCADGQGVCCIVEKSCRNVTRQLVSYFVNPSFPSTDTLGSFCDFRIDVTDENVCQIRLDLEEFSLHEPHRVMGICRNDRFMAMTSLPNGIGLSELCGENSGQHIYVPVDASVGSASVSLMVMTSGLKPYKWRVQATQVNCREMPELVAPVGCLQYHTGLSGDIMSFNYNAGRGHYQTNLDYAVCIKRSPNTCRVEYNQADHSAFWINSAEGPYLETGIGRAGTFPCDTATHDYLHIADGRGATEEEDEDPYGDPGTLSSGSADKFCGRALSGLAVLENSERTRTGYILEPPDNITTASTVTSYASGPIILRFHSDETSDPDQEIGFHISYRQLGTGCRRPLQ